MPKLLVSGYDNLVSNSDCALDLDAASVTPICIVPGPDSGGSYGDYAVTDDNDAAFAWRSSDTSYRFELDASDDQCLTGISG